MAADRGFRRYFRLPGQGGSGQEIDDELAFHFAETVDELKALGLSDLEARSEAERRFGDVRTWRRELAQLERAQAARVRRAEWFSALRQNLRFAFRGIARSPGFAAGVAVTLGLGIGANAVMFGLLDRLFLQPPAHVKDPGRVRRVYVERGFLKRRVTTSSLAYSDMTDFRAVSGFQAVAGYFGASMPFGRGAGATRVGALMATSEFFPLLGVHPVEGRFFDATEDSPGVGGTAVLGYRFWQRQFGGRRDALGQVLHLGSGAYTVIGVAPRGFTGVDLADVDVFLPLRNAAHEEIGGDWEHSRGVYWVRVVARLRPGVGLGSAEAEATTLHRAGRASDAQYDTAARVIVAPLLDARGPLASKDTKVSLWLAGVSVALLLIACANVINLMLARLTHRDREIAVRLALGAGRGRLVAQLVTEAVVLAALAALTGLLLAQAGSGLLRRAFLPDVTWSAGLGNGRVVLFTLAVTLLAGIIAGAVPAWRSSRPDLATALKVGRGGTDVGGVRLRAILLAAQAALSVVLLVGAGLFVRSLVRIRAMDTGFDMRHLLVAMVDLEAAGYHGGTAVALQERAMDDLRKIPGIRGVTGANSIPFWSSWSDELHIPGRDSIPRLQDGGPYINTVGTEYFGAMGIPIRRGRGFVETDRAGAERVAIVGATMARLIWTGEDPIGKCMIISSDTAPCTTVVGVAADAPRGTLLDSLTMQYYIPASQYGPASAYAGLFIRTSGEPSDIVEQVRRSLQTTASDLPFVDVRPLVQLTDYETRSWRLGATLFTAFGAMALVVAALGLYSVLSFSVARRTREIGIRSAMGATVGQVVLLVLRAGLRLVVLGLGAGFVVTLLGGRWIAPLLYQVSPTDPFVLLMAGLILVFASVAACVIPALRATRVAPMEALRAE